MMNPVELFSRLFQILRDHVVVKKGDPFLADLDQLEADFKASVAEAQKAAADLMNPPQETPVPQPATPETPAPPVENSEAQSEQGSEATKS
jgi:hypothetical protein